MEIGTRGGAPRGGSTDELKGKASELGDNARQRAMSTVDQQKDQVCGLLDKVAESMEGDRIGRFAADYARRGSQYLRGHSADELFSTVRSELRARPGLLLGVCFAAGLGIARVLRGTAEAGGGREREGWRGGDLHDDWRGSEAQGAWRGGYASRDEEEWRESPQWQGQSTWRGPQP